MTPEEKHELLAMTAIINKDIVDLITDKAQLEAENERLKTLLKSAGKMALCACAVTTSSALNVSSRITELEQSLDEYNRLIFQQ